jgi:hypothetical protein
MTIERWIIEIQTQYPETEMISLLRRAEKALCMDYSIAHPSIHYWTKMSGEPAYSEFDIHLGHRADNKKSRTDLFSAPPETPGSTLIDIADIPGHPPVYVAGAEIPLPEHCMHEIKDCHWCLTHPMVKERSGVVLPKKSRNSNALSFGENNYTS